jgi:hypothetical protein
MIEEVSNFAHVEHDGKAPSILRPDEVGDGADVDFEDPSIQEDQGGKRLVLRGCTDILCGGEK